MKAMILAAGLGTRLRPLTNDRPKALVSIAGVPLLEIVIRRLQRAGVTEIAVNAFHFAEMIDDFLREKNFGIRIELFREEQLLDTGGGLKNAAAFFLDGDLSEPFLLHNVDIVSNIDLAAMIYTHRRRRVLATLAVQDRKSSRQLLFDDEDMLCGRPKVESSSADEPNVRDEIISPPRPFHVAAFSGVHVISPRIFSLLSQCGAFSIIDAYLALVSSEKITEFRCDGAYWRDLGRPESLTAAERDLEDGLWRIDGASAK